MPGATAETFQPARRRAGRLGAPALVLAAIVVAMGISVSPPAGHGESAPMTIKDCDVCPVLVVVPAGDYKRGTLASERGRERDEAPRRDVHIGDAMAVGKFEVTFAEYAAFVTETGTRPSAGCELFQRGKGWLINRDFTWQHPGFRQTGRHPVTCVSWSGAVAYTTWLSGNTGKSYRLPSEAEWEYAARGGTTAARYWADGLGDACRHANVGDRRLKEALGVPWPVDECDDGHVFTAPVGSFPANPFGLHDMLGNVWEWVSDCRTENYLMAPDDGRPAEVGNCAQRGRRGGSWSSIAANVRSGNRHWGAADKRNGTIGFRVVREAPEHRKSP